MINPIRPADLKLACVVLPARGLHFAVVAYLGVTEDVQSRWMNRIEKSDEVRARQIRRCRGDQWLVGGGAAGQPLQLQRLAIGFEQRLEVRHAVR